MKQICETVKRNCIFNVIRFLLLFQGPTAVCQSLDLGKMFCLKLQHRYALIQNVIQGFNIHNSYSMVSKLNHEQTSKRLQLTFLSVCVCVCHILKRQLKPKSVCGSGWSLIFSLSLSLSLSLTHTHTWIRDNCRLGKLYSGYQRSGNARSENTHGAVICSR